MDLHVRSNKEAYLHSSFNIQSLEEPYRISADSVKTSKGENEKSTKHN